MPVYLSIRAARLAARACRDAALNAERQAGRVYTRDSRLEFLARAQEFEALAAKFDAHAGTVRSAASGQRK